uniref:Uncharacterized protein n=1 Tax=Arundo donax TaxID=35708 RepID=A0A0A8YUM4_ARUDO
MRAAAESEP